jgi:ribonuclease P protein component
VGEPTGGFRRSDRLLDARDFRRVSRTGRRFAGNAFVMLVAPSGPGAMPDARRLGISASRRVGNAVVRNRVKRGVREWFRRHRTMLPPGVDLVVIARRPAAELDAPAIAASLDALARRATSDATVGPAGQ